MEAANLVEFFKKICEGAIDKEVAELTDEQRFALCIIAGVQTETRMAAPSYQLTIKTKNPVGIVKIDGKFHIYEQIGGKRE